MCVIGSTRISVPRKFTNDKFRGIILSMAHYVNITAEEMHQFLVEKGFEAISLDGTVEAVYGKRVHQDSLQLTLRVYTGVVGSNSRKVGDDAIRVNLWMKLKDGRIIKLSGSKRVHRVEGWRTNLKKRIDGWLESFPKSKCKKCGYPMLVRKGPQGPFLGCSDYPVCKNTKSLETKHDR